MNEPPQEDRRWDAPFHAAAHTAAWCGVLWFFCFDVDRYKMVFMDFGLELPGIVMLIINVSDIVVKYWYVNVIALLIFIGVDTTACFAFKKAVSQWLWTAAMLIIPVTVLVVAKSTLNAVIRGLRYDLSGVRPWEWFGSMLEMTC